MAAPDDFADRWVFQVPRFDDPEAVGWAHPYGHDVARAWADCPRAPWLVRLAGRLGVERPLLVLAVCDCVRVALARVSTQGSFTRAAVEAAQRWATGELAAAEVRGPARNAFTYANRPVGGDADGRRWIHATTAAALVARAAAEEESDYDAHVAHVAAAPAQAKIAVDEAFRMSFFAALSGAGAKNVMATIWGLAEAVRHAGLAAPAQEDQEKLLRRIRRRIASGHRAGA